ncbi:MAG: hypothetical protein HC843_13085 [Sphingomonadales bacterium]|nr:hypothetical protein [Sphingomonadales bacterium]
MNLLSKFLETADRRGDNIAVIAGNGQRISYGALAQNRPVLPRIGAAKA